MHMKFKYFFLFYLVTLSFSLVSSESEVSRKRSSDDDQDLPRVRCVWCEVDFESSSMHDRKLCKISKEIFLQYAQKEGLTSRRKLPNKEKDKGSLS